MNSQIVLNIFVLKNKICCVIIKMSDILMWMDSFKLLGIPTYYFR